MKNKKIIKSLLLSTGDTVTIGDVIKVIHMEGEEKYGSTSDGLIGTLTRIDDFNQLHGTWSGLAILPEVDTFAIYPKGLKHKPIIIAPVGKEL